MIARDVLIVGSGLLGSVCARELSDLGFKCTVLEKRDHIGGNCYSERRDGIDLHMYGPHIFHTSNSKVWEYITKYSDFIPFIYSPVANYKGQLYSLPFNMWTFSKMWGITTPDEAKKIIDSQSSIISEIHSLEDQAIKLVGTDIYHKLIKGYTEKQWGKPAFQLPKEIITRLPVRFTYDSDYFNDIYQGIPSNGYTGLFKKLLQGIEVHTSCDYFENKEYWDSTSKLILYTGPIDRFFNYVFDPLEYKSQRFEHFHLTYTSNFQGTPVVNYTDSEVQYTRVIEHKHFQSRLSLNTPTTWITYEYPQLYNPDTTDPMYPVNDEVNTLKLKKYLELAEHQKNIIFRGRLAEYKYHDMDDTIERAFETVSLIIKMCNV